MAPIPTYLRNATSFHLPRVGQGRGRLRFAWLVLGAACVAGGGCDSGASEGNLLLGSSSDTNDPNRGDFAPEAPSVASGGAAAVTGGQSQQMGSSPPTPVIADGQGNVIEEPVPQLEAEEEVSLSFDLPAAGQRYVYAANPASDSVSVIDSQTLAIQSVQAGNGPTYVRTMPDADAALVLNVESEDATLIRTEGGVSTTTELPVVAGSNAIAIAPGGHHAVVFFDARLRSSGPAGSFQDISVVFADEEVSVPMTVGFRPSAVHFDSTGERGYVITEDGVSVLDFADVLKRGPHIAPTYGLGAEGEATTLDISVSPDGSYALSRLPEDAVLRLLDLEAAEGEPLTLDLRDIFAKADAEAAARLAEEAQGDNASVLDGGASAPDGGAAMGAESEPEVAEPPTNVAPPPFTDVTDVDMAPDGSYALAVVRDRRTVLYVPLPEAFTDPEQVVPIAVGAEIVGSVSIAKDGRYALLYTTAASDVERVTILNVEERMLRHVQLPKAVRAAAIAPDGRSALLMHQKLPGDPNAAGLTGDQLIDFSYGFSVLELGSGFYKLQLTPTEPGMFTVVPDSSYLFLLLNAGTGGPFEVQRVGLESFLVDSISLGSRPISLGVVPGANKVFVSQDHPDGRITFVDWTTAETESVTGFELNGRIRE